MKAFLFLLAAGTVMAQVDPYPGPYPYPGGSPIPGIPLPGRGKSKKTSKTKDAPQPLPSFSGTLKRLDSKAVELELDDFRVIEFKRTDKTKFLRKGEEVKAAEFKPGDHLSVEATEDPAGYMTAVNVYLEAPTKDAGDRPATTAPAPASAPPAPRAEEPKEPATTVAGPPAARDPDDPGPPLLRRGKPAPRNTSQDRAEPPARTAAPANAPAEAPDVRERAESSTQPGAKTPGPAPATEVASAAPAPAAAEPSVERVGETQPLGRAEDPVIRKAQEAALEFTETLPNYVCQEFVTRYQSESTPASWHPLDVVTTDLVYDEGKESYRNLTINGKKSSKSPEESGSWSTGEFGTMLIDLFSPATAADFRFRKTSRIAGIDARLYDFDVKRENSHWTIRSSSQSYMPAYSGSVWIDPRSGRAMRIEMQARNMPSEFPLDKVESAVDYDNIRLGGTHTFLLPVHAETLSCQRGSALCSRNTIDFRNYHKYTGESSIEFQK